jgi:hypothetical protein
MWFGVMVNYNTIDAGLYNLIGGAGEKGKFEEDSQ